MDNVQKHILYKIITEQVLVHWYPDPQVAQGMPGCCQGPQGVMAVKS